MYVSTALSECFPIELVVRCYQTSLQPQPWRSLRNLSERDEFQDTFLRRPYATSMALLVCSTSVHQSTLSYFPTTTSISSQCTRYERCHTSQSGSCGIAMGDHGLDSLEQTIPAVMRNSLSIHPFRICPATFTVHTFDHLIFATQYLEGSSGH